MAACQCPYEYLLSQYGQQHFQPFIDKLRPSLRTEDPAKYALVLETMDVVHFCAILVDDIADRSALRKNKPAAHVVFGETETATRAYLVLTRTVNRLMRESPVLAAELLTSLEEIHQGQDDSLVWRRDGLDTFPRGNSERLAAYKRMARLKTGSLFVLLGRLLNDGGTELDDLLTRFGWYAQLQNDCKNIYSVEYARNKGCVAEDLRNSEFSYPILVGLITDGANAVVERALQTRRDADIDEALRVLESPAVRDFCLQALKEASCDIEELVDLWGRHETMTSHAPEPATNTHNEDATSPEAPKMMETTDNKDITHTSEISVEPTNVANARLDSKNDDMVPPKTTIMVDIMDIMDTTDTAIELADTSTSTLSTQHDDMTSPESTTTTPTTNASDTTAELSTTDLAYWTQRCIPMVSGLLKSCVAYSPADQDAQLQFLKKYVLPNLGPAPSGPESQIVSMATFSGFPLQPSINLSSSGRARLRYTFEPLDFHSGTAADPFALVPAQRMLCMLASHLGVWPEWIETLVAAYHPTSEEVQHIRPKLRQYIRETLTRSTGQADVAVPEMPRMWVCFIAFDLDGPSQSMKVYFDPKVKEAATGIPSCKYTFQVLRSMESFGNATAVDMLEGFLAERQSVGAVELVAIDCVPEGLLPSARIKVYVHTMSNSFKTVRDYVTLGGRLTDPVTLESLSRLRNMWHLLLSEPNGIDDESWNKALTGFSPMQHRLYISYEMKPGDSNPAVKVYIPVQNYAPDDSSIVENYEANFRQCGWPWGQVGSYRSVIESAFGPANHHRASFLHGGSSFTFADGKGVYQSIYLDPPSEMGQEYVQQQDLSGTAPWS